jgi:hypothetical protein
MRNRIMFALILCLYLAINSSATTYYMRQAGDDSNNGRSWATAWRTIGHMDTRITAGDSVIFGAGRYLNAFINPPLNTDFNRRTVYIDSSYLNGGPACRAEINGGDSITGWTPYDTTGTENIWRAKWDLTKFSYIDMIYNRTHTLVQDNELLYHPISGYPGYSDDSTDIDEEGEMWMNPYTADTIIYAWIYNDANPNEVEMLASPRPVVYFQGAGPYGGSQSALQNHVLFKGLDLRVGDGRVVNFSYLSGGSDSVFFEHCNFSYSATDRGSNPALLCTGNILPNWVEYLTVRACTLRYCLGVGNTAGDDHIGLGCKFYAARKVTVDSCYFDNLQGGGIGFKNGNYNDYGQDADSNIIAFNHFHGGSLTHAIWLGYKVARTEIYGNIFSDIAGIAVEFLTFYEGGNNTVHCVRGGNKVFNNTFYNCGNFISMSYFNLVTGEDNLIKYNVFYDVKNTSPFGDKRFMQFSHPYGQYEDPLTETYYAIDSNMYYDPIDAFRGYAYDNDRNWSGWQSSGFDTHGRNANPMLADPAHGNFSRNVSVGEMDTTYGGKTWTIYGAWQPNDPLPPPTDTIAPCPPDSLYGTPGDSHGEIDLNWLAPGDDCDTGLAHHYDIRYSLNPISEATWGSALSVIDPPVPVTPGQWQSHTIDGLSAGEMYYIALKTYDEVNNISDLSDVLNVYAAGIAVPFQLTTDIDTTQNSVTLTAQAVESYYSLFYVFELDSLASFQEPDSGLDLSADTIASATFANLSADINYFWRICAAASDGSDNSAWSPFIQFNLISGVTPTLTAADCIYPPHGAAVFSNQPVFVVRSLSDIDYYYFQVDTDTGFNMPVESEPVSRSPDMTTSWQVSEPLEANVEYYWRVSSNGVIWTSPLSFTAVLEIHPYPNPFRPSLGHTHVTFINLLENSDITISTISGMVVLQQTGIGPADWIWNVKNSAGSDLASGVYLYNVSFPAGSASGKVMVIR